jgi:hypothetical protein
MAERKQVPLEGPSMKQVNCLLATITMNHNWWLVLYMIPAQMPHDSGGWLRRARLLGTMLYLPHHVLYKNTTNRRSQCDTRILMRFTSTASRQFMLCLLACSLQASLTRELNWAACSPHSRCFLPLCSVPLFPATANIGANESRWAWPKRDCKSLPSTKKWPRLSGRH